MNTTKIAFAAALIGALSLQSAAHAGLEPNGWDNGVALNGWDNGVALNGWDNGMSINGWDNGIRGNGWDNGVKSNGLTAGLTQPVDGEPAGVQAVILSTGERISLR